jgi:ABC-type sugar transport system ATPase subunit
VFVLDEPTRGIDIGAKSDVYNLVRTLCADGAAVVVVSSELDEIRHLADRIVVMAGGRVHDRLDVADYDEERVLRAAFATDTVHHVSPVEESV